MSSSTGQWLRDPSLSAFTPSRFDPEMEYWGIRCPCGSRALRVSGSPRAALGRGSYFWRSVTRVWREARIGLRDIEPPESPFLLPVWLHCAECGREEAILANRKNLAWASQTDANEGIETEPGTPREAYRCRDCRRGTVHVVIGLAVEPPRDRGPRMTAAGEEIVAAEVTTQCRGCQREARLAWFDERPSPQEQSLDLLYGRR